MSTYGDSGAHLIQAMVDSERLVTESRRLTVEQIFETYGQDPEALAKALISACRTIADLQRQIAYDYWPGA